MQKPLRIAINAQIIPGSGTSSLEGVLRVLTAVGRLEGDEEYVFITPWSEPDWLQPFLNDCQTIIPAPPPENPAVANRFENLKRLTGKLRPLARRIKQLAIAPPKFEYKVPVSDGFYESLNCDVIHFPYPEYTYCHLPTIYNPHDLQHLHYPEFFMPEVIHKREILYPAACLAAEIVVAGSQFIKQDLIEKFGVEADKIQVIPWSPPKITAEKFTEKDVAAVFEKYECPPRPFILFPAMTWEHKNHLRLLEAIALLRERDGLKINLICTGYKHEFYKHIEQKLQELNLEKQVKFTGIVSIEELSLLYRQAQFVIIPTLFEAASGPLFEAWQYGAATACSAVTSLPEQAADAALLFNPFSVEEIADAVKKMSLDENLRTELRTQGFRRLADFDLERTAKAYRAVYRKAAGRNLSEEDHYLLNWDWMRDSPNQDSK
ncbi:MAG: glycosyltransferase family 4 protein [Aridibacter sp.]